MERATKWLIIIIIIVLSLWFIFTYIDMTTPDYTYKRVPCYVCGGDGWYWDGQWRIDCIKCQGTGYLIVKEEAKN